MQTRLTSTFRSRLADLLTGQPTGPVAAATAFVGNGAADAYNQPVPPQDSMYAQTQACRLTVSRNAANEVLLFVQLPAGNQTITFNEVGVFAADGTLILHATMPAQTLSAGVEASFEFTLNPEDTQ